MIFRVTEIPKPLAKKRHFSIVLKFLMRFFFGFSGVRPGILPKNPMYPPLIPEIQEFCVWIRKMTQIPEIQEFSSQIP